MKIEINFEIGETVWFISPKNMKACSATLKGIKFHKTSDSEQIKYQVDLPAKNANELKFNEPEFYVWAIYKSKEDLLKNL